MIRREGDYAQAPRRQGGVGIVSKDPLFADGLASLVEHEGPFVVSLQTKDLGSCLKLAPEHQLDVLVVDTEHLTREELSLLPGVRAMGAVKVISLEAGTRADADISVPRFAGKAQLLKAIREATHAIRRVVRESRGAFGSRMTPREYDVARLVAQGLSNRSIAGKLDLREQSVKNLVSVIMRKLRCENRVQVALRLSASSQLEATA